MTFCELFISIKFTSCFLVCCNTLRVQIYVELMVLIWLRLTYRFIFDQILIFWDFFSLMMCLVNLYVDWSYETLSSASLIICILLFN